VSWFPSGGRVCWIYYYYMEARAHGGMRVGMFVPEIIPRGHHDGSQLSHVEMMMMHIVGLGF